MCVCVCVCIERERERERENLDLHTSYICPVTLQNKQSHQLTQFQITNWRSDGRCENFKTVTDVNEEVIKIQIKSGNKSILVHCL